MVPAWKKNELFVSESAQMVEMGRFCFWFVLSLFPLALPPKADPPPPREKREKISAGAEKKERPPERATLLKRIREEASRKAKP